jgi:hypothetical protein
MEHQLAVKLVLYADVWKIINIIVISSVCRVTPSVREFREENQRLENSYRRNSIHSHLL